MGLLGFEMSTRFCTFQTLGKVSWLIHFPNTSAKQSGRSIQASFRALLGIASGPGALDSPMVLAASSYGSRNRSSLL